MGRHSLWIPRLTLARSHRDDRFSLEVKFEPADNVMWLLDGTSGYHWTARRLVRLAEAEERPAGDVVLRQGGARPEWIASWRPGRSIVIADVDDPSHLARIASERGFTDGDLMIVAPEPSLVTPAAVAHLHRAAPGVRPVVVAGDSFGRALEDALIDGQGAYLIAMSDWNGGDDGSHIGLDLTPAPGVSLAVDARYVCVADGAYCIEGFRARVHAQGGRPGEPLFRVRMHCRAHQVQTRGFETVYAVHLDERRPEAVLRVAPRDVGDTDRTVEGELVIHAERGIERFPLQPAQDIVGPSTTVRVAIWSGSIVATQMVFDDSLARQIPVAKGTRWQDEIDMVRIEAVVRGVVNASGIPITIDGDIRRNPRALVIDERAIELREYTKEDRFELWHDARRLRVTGLRRHADDPADRGDRFTDQDRLDLTFLRDKLFSGSDRVPIIVSEPVDPKGHGATGREGTLLVDLAAGTMTIDLVETGARDSTPLRWDHRIPRLIVGRDASVHRITTARDPGPALYVLDGTGNVTADAELLNRLATVSSWGLPAGIAALRRGATRPAWMARWAIDREVVIADPSDAFTLIRLVGAQKFRAGRLVVVAPQPGLVTLRSVSHLADTSEALQLIVVTTEKPTDELRDALARANGAYALVKRNDNVFELEYLRLTACKGVSLEVETPGVVVNGNVHALDGTHASLKVSGGQAGKPLYAVRLLVHESDASIEVFQTVWAPPAVKAEAKLEVALVESGNEPDRMVDGVLTFHMSTGDVRHPLLPAQRITGPTGSVDIVVNGGYISARPPSPGVLAFVGIERLARNSVGVGRGERGAISIDGIAITVDIRAVVTHDGRSVMFDGEVIRYTNALVIDGQAIELRNFSQQHRDELWRGDQRLRITGHCFDPRKPTSERVDAFANQDHLSLLFLHGESRVGADRTPIKISKHTRGYVYNSSVRADYDGTIVVDLAAGTVKVELTQEVDVD